MGEFIHFETTAQGIGVLRFDRKGSSANFLDQATLEEFQAALDAAARDSSLKGLVITSSKPSIFVAGADVHKFTEGVSEREVRAYVEFGHTQICHLSTLPFPTVAAIHGACLGGGYELCLACDWRVGSSAEVTRIGLPETTLGLLPAWGGTTRLPRLIGLEPALDLILTGKALTAQQALEMGLLDDLVPQEDLIEKACEGCLRGRRPVHEVKPVFSAEALAQILKQRSESLRRKTHDHSPAPRKALEVAVAGTAEPLDVALASERKALFELVQSQPTQNELRFFFLKERARKVDKRSPEPLPVSRIAVIGAGTMGAGIAYWASSHHIHVAVQDVDSEAVARGLARISQIYSDGVKRHLLTADEARAGLDKISIPTSDSELENCDLVIEAVVEVLETKQQVFQQIDRVVSESALLASNTSALPISDIAQAVRRPQRLVGLHFFNPVHRMVLVELIAGRKTDPAAMQRAKRFVQQHGKLPVLVRDSPGFVANRVLMPYLMEAVRLLAAGASRADIDETMVEFAMAMGPLRLIDEIGIDVTLHITSTLVEHFGSASQPPDLLRQMAQAGRLGRKSGAGFYSYGAEAAKALSPKPDPLFPDNPQRAAGFTREALRQRMVLLMINESSRCLEEHVVSEASEIDFVFMTGLGFATSVGGPLRYTDSLGVGRVVAELENLAMQEGSRFEPCSLLRELAARGGKFCN